MGCFIQNETAVRPWSCEVILGPDSADEEEEEECDSPPRYEDPEKMRWNDVTSDSVFAFQGSDMNPPMLF